MTTTYRPQGIVPVLQTPFLEDGGLDLASYERLVDDAFIAGAAGFLTCAVASEVSVLDAAERAVLMETAAAVTAGRAPLLAGCSAEKSATVSALVETATAAGASAYLVAVPDALYSDEDSLLDFFETIAQTSSLPLVIQDLEWSGPGLSLATIDRLRDALPTLAGLKIETVPAGPKYTAVRELCGDEFFIAGGWAVPQMIEALDRGVDALIPEASMVRVYTAIDRQHRDGRRDGAVSLFRDLLPLLSFANQEILTSIAFFKRLLVKRGVFSNTQLRLEGFVWDAYNARIADELIERYLDLETRFAP
jgi:dihydrodipicolinate synthase/N-acetylneuraminate lyase